MSSPFSRRRMLGLLGAGATTAALAGCTGRTGGNGDPNHLIVWGGVPASNGPQKIVDAFQESHPGVTVEYTRFVNDARGNLKLDTALQGGVDIDVYFTYATANLALRTSSGMALDLSDRVRATPALATYLDRQQPRSSWSGESITGLTTVREPNFILFNETLRRRAGVELPTSWTAEDYHAVARRISSDDTPAAYTVPDLARIALGPNYWYSGDGSNFDAPVFEERLVLGQQMIADGSAFPWTEVLARQMDVYQHSAFVQQEFAVWPTAPFNLRYLNDATNYPHDFTVAAAPVPSLGENWNTGIYGNHIMINPRSTKADLAWEFVTFWILQGAEAMLAGGKIPALDDLLEPEQVLAGLLGDDADRFFDVDSFRRAMFDPDLRLVSDTDLTAVPEITLITQQQSDLCWIRERTPAEAVATMKSQADAAIRRGRREAA